jgi:hypothetical protein
VKPFMLKKEYPSYITSRWKLARTHQPYSKRDYETTVLQANKNGEDYLTNTLY